MTENKRFGVITNWCVYEKIDGVEKWLTFDETVTILNQLSEENEQLKNENDIVKEMNNIITRSFKDFKHQVYFLIEKNGDDLLKSKFEDLVGI